ncbi:MAG: ComEC family competence protein [Bacteroidetes bacterium]|nr:ComEC family competence protein [Bacteroidota bacterium]
MINLKSIPFLKILLPFVAGIICALQWGQLEHIHAICIGSLVAVIISFLFQRFHKSASPFKKGVYTISITVFLFVLAFESCFLYNAKNNPYHYSHYVSGQRQSFMACIEDIPVSSEKFIKLSVNITGIESNNRWYYAEGKTMVYLKAIQPLKLDIGNTLLIRSKFSYLNAPNNPYEFDYRSFLERKNIFHTIFAAEEDLFVIPQENRFVITELGTRIKSHVVSVLKQSALSQEAFSICAALLVGYDDEIDSGVMQSFSHSGTLHILSVSGMHTAVLYGILIFIFSLFDKYDKFKKTKLVVVMLFLLLFVFVTGLSPSVLRAALMLGLVMFGKTFYKQGNSYNTLLLSAFLLLLFNPYLIMDVGFLLSYLAVFGIMYLYPILSKIYHFDNKYIQSSWSGVLMSVSATLFTLPVSLYYFHQFPVWFIVSNLIIIPMSMLIMGAAALFLIVYKIAGINQIVAYIINGVTSLMIQTAELTDSPSYGFVDNISFSLTDLFFLSVVIALALIVIYSKQYRYVLTLCVSLIAWVSGSVYANYESSLQKELVVFHVRKKPAFALRIGQTVYTHMDEVSEKERQRYIKPYLLRVSGLKVIPATADVFKNTSATILSADQQHIPISDIQPDYIVVSHNTPIELTTNYKIKPIVIADCSNSPKFVKNLQKQCNDLAVPFYSVKESGALRIQL